ncbi:MAG: hypothetical protein COB36_10845 [Alphaproteobacteria bacterium]|nr:MAG: hypothetical protein COB36_10845 [Alphaproteobacteria bacterium]
MSDFTQEQIKCGATIAPDCAVEKHTDLYNSIREAGSILSALDRLINRITGPEPKENNPLDNTKHVPPTLLEVLDTGAKDLIALTAVAHTKIDNLNEILFTTG